MTDSKYLALLGLDGQAGTTAAPSKAQNVTVVTLLRPGSEQHIYGFLRNISHYLPNNNIAVFGVGLSDYASQAVRTVCNSSRCNVIQLDLSPFPAHAEDDRLHVYRPLVIQVFQNFIDVTIIHPNYRTTLATVLKFASLKRNKI